MYLYLYFTSLPFQETIGILKFWNTSNDNNGASIMKTVLASVYSVLVLTKMIYLFFSFLHREKFDQLWVIQQNSAILKASLEANLNFSPIQMNISDSFHIPDARLEAHLDHIESVSTAGAAYLDRWLYLFSSHWQHWKKYKILSIWILFSYQ